MTNPTSNFNWQMPTASDLVTDLPADFEVFGQAVDTSLADLKGGTTGQVLKKNSNTDMDFVWGADSAGMTNPMTTTGDTIYSSSGSTPARLGIGTTGQVLTVSGGVPTWATASSFSNFTLLNTGGTAMTGATSITVNVSTKETYMILFASVSAGASANFELRINGDTGNNYDSFGGYYSGSSPSATGSINDNRIQWARMGSVAAESCRGGLYVKGGSTTGGKLVHSVVFSEGTASALMSNYSVYKGSAAVTSFTFISSTGNFDAGTVYIFGGN
jgi:hypothetical protein